MEKGVKFDQGKPQWRLVPFGAMTEVVDVLTYGANKYSPDNWKYVNDAQNRYIDAGFRHFTLHTQTENSAILKAVIDISLTRFVVCCFLLAFERGDHED
jgi:hypothetical protein